MTNRLFPNIAILIFFKKLTSILFNYYLSIVLKKMLRYGENEVKILSIQLGLLIVILFSLISCSSIKSLNQSTWLIGTWQVGETNDRKFEAWDSNEPYEFHGKAFKIDNASGDTLLLESMVLMEMEQGIYFIPIVIGQNEDLPVVFKAERLSKRILEFSNPEHDFPQNIIYQKVREDSIVAEINGWEKGVWRSVVFPMKKVDR